MRVADYIFEFVAKLGVRDVFLISGGGAMHLVDAAGRNKKVRFWCNHHEQASAMAAEGYARRRGGLGVAVVTSGPGGTNTLTGLAGSWLDSVPVLFISGQVKLADTVATNPGLRQFGDQELNIVDVVKPVTKYAAMVDDKNDIRYHLEKAVFLAQEGRPGPVWIDVPLDIQASDVSADSLRPFRPPRAARNGRLDGAVRKVCQALKRAQRPLLILGQGIRLAGAENKAKALADLAGVPVVTSILGKDLLAWDHPLNMGTPGIAGQRGANLVVQNCDFLLAIGSRLMLRQIGFDYGQFAPHARKAVVDIDPKELDKKSVQPEIAIQADAGEFMDALMAMLRGTTAAPLVDPAWLGYCRKMKAEHNGPDPWHLAQDKKWVNSYVFIDRLSEKIPRDVPVVTANGTAYISTLQTFKQKPGQRLIYNKACASMGYGLPAAIGVCIAGGARPVVCLENDGSLQMNLQELQTVAHHRLPLKLVVFNNDGYLSIKLTQKSYFPDNICASTPQTGISFPDLKKIAGAYGIPYLRLARYGEMDAKIAALLAARGPVILEVMMDPWQMMVPKAVSKKLPDGRMVSRPLQDMFPLLGRAQLRKSMFKENA